MSFGKRIAIVAVLAVAAWAIPSDVEDLVVVPLHAQTCTITAASASRSAVGTAVTAAVDGDVVCVPGGSATWTTQLSISNKSIQLIGAGDGTTAQCAVSGQTTYTCITNAFTGGGNSSETALLLWETKPTGNTPAGYTRISGFTFLDSNVVASSGDQAMTIHIRGDTSSFRFDNNRVVAQYKNGMIFQEYVRGLVDHNVFELKGSLGHMVGVQHGSWENTNGATGYGDGQGDQSWAVASTTGSESLITVEDNTFTTALSGDQYYTNDQFGSRATYRFNTFINGVYADHGTETGGRLRSARHVEIYNNTFETDRAVASYVGIRGGTGMVFDNELTGTAPSNSFMTIENYRSDDYSRSSAYFPFNACGQFSGVSLSRSGTTVTATRAAGEHGRSSQGYSTITGSVSPFNGTFVTTRVSATVFTYTTTNSGATSGTGTVQSVFDGNTASTGYPCMDQPGRGFGLYMAGNGPDFAPAITPLSSLAQALEPIYNWNNTVNASVSHAVSNAGVAVANRDFYNYNTSFTGATGVGRGLRSARPSTCTTGVAYWSTDGGTSWNTLNGATADGGLDKCTATNTWTNNWYVPASYPHSLQGEVCDCEDPEEPDLPPTLTITAPAATSETIASTLTTLAGTCTDDGTVVVTWVNDQGGSGTASGTTSWTVSTLTLTTEAVNTITVTCTDDATVPQTDEAAVAVLRVTVPGTPLDTFTRGTWGTLGPNWTSQNTPLLLTSGGTAVATSDTGHQCSFWTPHTLPANQYSEATIIGTLSNTRRNRVTVLAAGTTAATHDYYALVAASTTTLIVKMINNVQTTLQTVSFITWATGDVMKLEIVNGTLRAYQNGAQIGTDQASGGELTSGAPGVCGSASAVIDNFSAGITSAAENPLGIPHPKWRLRRGGNNQ
jgi:hypothetical protein